MDNYDLLLHIITPALKARIFLENILGQDRTIQAVFHDDDISFLEYQKQSAGTEPSKDEKIIVLADADSFRDCFPNTDAIRNSFTTEIKIIVFSIDDISEDIRGELDVDGTLKLPFSSDEIRRYAGDNENAETRENDLILFVDDSRLIHKMVDAIINPQGFDIEHAYNGLEGFRMAEKLNPDLIITDIQMPEMDGYELCRKIKEDDRLCRIPVMIQSSLSDGFHIDRGFESGADDYITKPINAAELVSRINSFLSSVPESRETILVADNSRLITNMIITGLRKQGFNCISASNGPDIIKAAGKDTIDLFIISQVLSGMEGREVVRSLRRNPFTKSCPVIMLSSRDSKLDLIKSKSAGVSEFISKPFSVERMLVTVEKLLADYRFAKERDAMSLYMSEAALDHAEELAKSNKPLSMRAEDGFRTILFTDIVGFTPLCEELRPDKVISLLNSYFDLIVDKIRNNGGTIDKFIGDAVMAVYAGRENGAYLAVKTGLEILDALDDFNKESIRKLSIRIGINSGDVVLGDLGSKHFRRDYTLIGDAVNIAQRLEGAAPHNRILVSDAVMKLVEDYFTAESREPIELKGKQELVKTHLITGIRKETELSSEMNLSSAAVSG